MKILNLELNSMVLVWHVNNDRLEVFERVDSTVFYFNRVFIRGYNLQYTSFF